MSKKNFDRMIRENQRLNHINLRMFAVASKSTSVNEEIAKETKNKKKAGRINNKNNKFKSSINMALSSGKQTTEGGNFKMYVGYVPMKCKLVCPTKEQLTQATGHEWTKDQNYTKIDDKGIKQANIVFLMTIDRKIGEESIKLNILHNITIKNTPRYKQDGSKFQVVDKWGNFSWVTEAEFNNHTTPLSSNGKKLKIDASNWRKAYLGEETLMKLLKPRLNIDDAFEYKNNEWVVKSNTEGCECRLDEVAKYFDGNFSEIQNALNIMPENEVKGFVYVDEYQGKQRQVIAREFVNLASNKTEDLKKEIEDFNSNNNTNFSLCEFQEYKVESTQFAPTNNQMPEMNNSFGNNNSPWAN